MVPLLDPVDGGAMVGAAPAVPTNQELVLTELWISFVSLLRSHLGAMQVTGRLAQAVCSQLTPSSIEVADLSRTMHLELQTASGLGEWSLTRLGEMIAAGDWHLGGDATVTIDGGTAQDMELGVEEFTRKLWAKTAPGGTSSL
jgi:hypothetical protein